VKPGGRGLRPGALAKASFLLLGLLVSPLLRAEMTRCPTAEVTVRHTGAAEAAKVCEAVADAVGFMTAHGFELKAPFTIAVVDQITQSPMPSSLGAFNAATREIEILGYDAATRFFPDRPPFGIPMNPEIYRSFVVHEVAHAVAHPNFVRRPNLAAMEYIAYTVQIATMPEPLRRRVLASVETEAFEQPREIGDQLVMFDPARFAVKSYLHFIRPENGAAFYQRLLTGKF
jgi:hypothetical protein